MDNNYMLLVRGHAFFAARPRKIVNIEQMTARQIYWTLVQMEDKTEHKHAIRNEEGNLLRECRLRNVTMVDDEKDLWFLFRNGQLRLGHGQSWRRHSKQRKQPKRRLGKCCMCRVEADTWDHALVCPTRIEWTREILDTVPIKEFDTAYKLRQASTLEAKTMTRLQCEVMSKLWCAWYEMWTAWTKRKVRSKKQMKKM